MTLYRYTSCLHNLWFILNGNSYHRTQQRQGEETILSVYPHIPLNWPLITLIFDQCYNTMKIFKIVQNDKLFRVNIILQLITVIMKGSFVSGNSQSGGWESEDDLSILWILV